ncbi:hypothetical protein [Xanthomonas oryzae]|uniref:hypothetical protein n=1 Tax=Xanthomonas oryzae TaxID=347 RepID=UPI003DA0FE2C
MRIRVTTYPDQITGKPRQSSRVALIRDGTAVAGGRKRPTTVATMDRWAPKVPPEVAGLLEPEELAQVQEWMAQRDEQVAGILRQQHLDHIAEHASIAADALDAGLTPPSYLTVWEGIAVLEDALERAGQRRPPAAAPASAGDVRDKASRESGPSRFVPENLAELMRTQRPRRSRAAGGTCRRREPSPPAEAGRVLRGRMGRKAHGFAQWLEPLSALPLGAAELSQAISAVLSRDGIPHVVQTGRLLVAKVGTVPRHTWVALLASGSICDFRAQMRLRETEGVPHGVFIPEDTQRYTPAGELPPLDPAAFHEKTGIALQAYPPSASFA